MFGEFEHADEPDDTQERERRAGLGAGAAHRRQDVDERHVVRHDRHHVDDVLELLPRPRLPSRPQSTAACKRAFSFPVWLRV